MKLVSMLIIFSLIDYMTKSEEMVMVMQGPSQFRANNIKCVLNFLITIGVDFDNKQPKQVLRYSNEIVVCNEQMNKTYAKLGAYNKLPYFQVKPGAGRNVFNSSNKFLKPLLISFYNIHKNHNQSVKDVKEHEIVKVNSYPQPSAIETKDLYFFYYKYYFLFYYMVGSTSFTKQYYEHQERLNSIKIIILNSLGLKTKPNVTLRAPRKAVVNIKGRRLKEKYFFKSEKYTSIKSLNQQRPPNASRITTKIYLTKYKYMLNAKEKMGEENNRQRSIYEFFNSQEVLFYSAKETKQADNKRTIVTLAFSAIYGNNKKGVKSGTTENRPRNRLVRKATLWLRLGNDRHGGGHVYVQDDKAIIWIFRLLKTNGITTTKWCAVKKLKSRGSQWINFEITRTLYLWNFKDSEHFHFLLECSGFCSQNHRFDKAYYNWQMAPPDHIAAANISNNEKDFFASINIAQNEIRDESEYMLFRSSLSYRTPDLVKRGFNQRNPFLIIYAGSDIMRRTRRRINHCSNYFQGQCCRERFYVNFRELGWNDWIIAPHGYYANYCKGNCKTYPLNGRTKSNHGHVISEYRKHERTRNKIIQSCCTPIKFSSISVIYYEDNNKIVKRDVPSMVVDDCGCP